MDFNHYLATQAHLIETELAQRLPQPTRPPQIIHEAMRYSCLGGGKRLRAILALEANAAVGGSKEAALDFACAIEMIHAYSLVHDDLPAMDDDDYRRGKPTSHKVYGEALAILTGDALLTHAFTLLASMADYLDPLQVVQIISETGEACGTQGLIGGQVMDLAQEGQQPDGDVLQSIYRNKTGRLIIAALRGGALIGGADPGELALISRYGENFGLAFQITDDILDLTGDFATLGKEIGADVRQKKSTYPLAFGMEQAKSMVKSCTEQCLEIAGCLPQGAPNLQALAKYGLHRLS